MEKIDVVSKWQTAAGKVAPYFCLKMLPGIAALCKI